MYQSSVTLCGLLLGTRAEAHMWQMEPVSRQYGNGPVFKAWPFSPIEYAPSYYNANGPEITRQRAIANTEPSVLANYGGGEWPFYSMWRRGEIASNGNHLEPEEVAVRHGVCGDPIQNLTATSYKEDPVGTYGTPNTEWPILESYKEGQVLDIKLGVRAYHWGHVEFNLCDTSDMEEPDGVVTQGCLNKYPLTRAEGDSVNSPIDPAYPGRYYVDPECREFETDQTRPEATEKGYLIHMRYQLPSGLTCEHCVLQMVYYTGHICKHHGYDEFNPTSWPSECAPEKKDWINTFIPLCGEYGTYPEEFWACSDFAITADGMPNPTPSPVPSTTTPAPVCVTEPFTKCRGESLLESKCCPEGYECTDVPGKEDRYSECLPEVCAEDWAQCGGIDFDSPDGEAYSGPSCCLPGSSCVQSETWWSACIPDSLMEEEVKAESP